MVSAKVKIKALMNQIEEICQQEGLTFRSHVWGRCSWEGGIMELDETGKFVQREPQKFKRSESGITMKVTFYDSDKPKELNEQPLGIRGLLNNNLMDLFDTDDESDDLD